MNLSSAAALLSNVKSSLISLDPVYTGSCMFLVPPVVVSEGWGGKPVVNLSMD